MFLKLNTITQVDFMTEKLTLGYIIRWSAKNTITLEHETYFVLHLLQCHSTVCTSQHTGQPLLEMCSSLRLLLRFSL